MAAGDTGLRICSDALLMLGARPAARNALLSGPVQSMALKQTAPVPMTQAAQAVLENGHCARAGHGEGNASRRQVSLEI